MSCPDSETLSDFLLGRLPAWEIDGVSAHLESCQTCCARLLFTDGVDVLLRLVQSGQSLSADRDPLPEFQDFEDESACDRVIATLTAEFVRHSRDHHRHDRDHLRHDSHAEVRIERESPGD